MDRNEAILMIQDTSGKTIRESRRYLERIIDLYTPEFDSLRYPDQPISGTKSSHLKGIVNTYTSNGQEIA